MISPKSLLEYLKKKGYGFYSGVPCSILKDLLREISAAPGIRYVPAVRENAALGAASGACLAGERSVILMQNSGLGNIVNALTSFNLIYKIPVLMFITWRGLEGRDAPEHIIMGEKMTTLLEDLGIPYRILTKEYRRDVDWASETMEDRSAPVALIIKDGLLG